MFGFIKKAKKEPEINSVESPHKETDQFTLHRTEAVYERLVYDSTIEQLEIIVNTLEEPYILTIEELKYMLSICEDDLRKGCILYGMASCCYDGNRGLEQSLKQALKYDEQASAFNYPPAALRYGVKLLGSVEDDYAAGTIDDGSLQLWRGLAVGEMVKSYNLGFKEKAHQVLEMVVDSYGGEFFGCHTVGELIDRFSEYQSFNGQK